MFSPKFRFTHDEVRIIVLALIELKNQLIAEGRYTASKDGFSWILRYIAHSL